LAQPSKGSLLGVVIGRDTPQARRKALEYQSDIQRRFGIILPIILYDATKNELIEDLCLHETRLKSLRFIQSLSNYIARIEDKKMPSGENNYRHGFWFASTSRALNRKANYYLAIQLRDMLLNNPGTSLPSKDEIQAIRKELIHNMGIHDERGYVKRGLNSTELNKVVDEMIGLSFN